MQRITLTTRQWVLLLALTLMTCWFAGRAWPQGIVTALVLGIVLVKGHVVIDHFMGLAQGGGIIHRIVTGWLVCVVLLVGVAYWLGASMT